MDHRLKVRGPAAPLAGLALLHSRSPNRSVPALSESFAIHSLYLTDHLYGAVLCMSSLCPVDFGSNCISDWRVLKMIVLICRASSPYLGTTYKTVLCFWNVIYCPATDAYYPRP
jgi:hypothetical protein